MKPEEKALAEVLAAVEADPQGLFARSTFLEVLRLLPPVPRVPGAPVFLELARKGVLLAVELVLIRDRAAYLTHRTDEFFTGRRSSKMPCGVHGRSSGRTCASRERARSGSRNIRKARGSTIAACSSDVSLRESCRVGSGSASVRRISSRCIESTGPWWQNNCAVDRRVPILSGRFLF